MSIRSALVALAVLWSTALGAQGITIPNTFVNGTAADATQVNANFSSLANNALNRTGGTMTGVLVTVGVTPTVTNTSDVGSASLLYRSAYVRTSLVLGQAAGNYTLTWANPAAARAISFEDPGGTDVLVYKAATQTLTNKTITAPVLSGTTTGTYTLAGTPTLSGTFAGSYTMGGSGIWNAGAVTSSGAITVTSGGVTTSVQAGFFGTSSAHDLVLLTSNATRGKWFAGGGFSWGDTTDPGATNFRVAGTSTLIGSVNLGSTNVTDAVATPTITSGAGSTGTIAGKVYGFVVTTGGAGIGSIVTVAFNMTFANIPSVIVGTNISGAKAPLHITATTTNVTITSDDSTAFVAGSEIHVHVRGF